MRWARHQVIPVVPVSVSLTTSPTSSSPNGRADCLCKTNLGGRGKIRKKVHFCEFFPKVNTSLDCRVWEILSWFSFSILSGAGAEKSPRNVSAKPRSRTLLSLFSLATHMGGFHLYKDVRRSAQLGCSGWPEGALGLELETLCCNAGWPALNLEALEA